MDLSAPRFVPAVEVRGEPAGPLVITCEHATNLVPPPLEPRGDDARWLETHWGWDPGAAFIADELVRQSGSIGIFSRFSRLVCDPNRSVEDPTWIRTEVEGAPIEFNQGITVEERRRRQKIYHDPYHEALDAVLANRLASGGDVLLFSVHTFTRVLQGQVREMEAGVLFDQYEPVARRFASLLEGEGLVTALNEPYSGLAETMYAAYRHGREHGVIYLELEIRQDLVGSEAAAREIGQRTWRALQALKVRRRRRPPQGG